MRKIQIYAAAAAVLCFMVSACSSDSKNLIGGALADKIGSVDASTVSDLASGKSQGNAKTKKQYSGKDTSGADSQYIQPDDYFISSDAFKSQAWIHVTLSKMISAPTAQTKSEGKFMQIGDGREVWTKNYWKTRIASQSDIRLGTIIIAFDTAGEESIYRAPESKEEARTSAWFMAKVTDTSDIHKGYVMVSGGYKVSLEALRVIVSRK